VLGASSATQPRNRWDVVFPDCVRKNAWSYLRKSERNCLVFLVWVFLGERRVSILSLKMCLNYNKCFLAEKILQRAVVCNYRGGRGAVHAHLQ